jgi:hypothetical protein
MHERWLLFLDATYQALPWPWPGEAFETIAADRLWTLPAAIDDFTRYSPSDGTIDMVQVPRDLPREVPRCRTRLAVYHDDERVYVCLAADTPVEPIPELVDVHQEDFTCVIPCAEGTRGLYFGLNERGEAIGLRQVWDADLQPDDVADRWPMTLATDGGVLPDGYCARVAHTPAGIVGGFSIAKRLLAGAITDNAFLFTAGRRCYATSELVSWGSSVLWSPRPDRHGLVRLVTNVAAPGRPQLARLELDYDPAQERGTVLGRWHGAAPAEIGRLDRGTYAGYAGKAAWSINGDEQCVDLAPETSVDARLRDGWNRVEIMTAGAPLQVVAFQKLSGHRIMPLRIEWEQMPTRDELIAAFHDWHLANEQLYCGHGRWGDPAAPRPCLCHCGVFHAEPYLLALEQHVEDAVFRLRVRETAERMLRAQHADGVYPCYCSAAEGEGEPKNGDGGAFSNGSVGAFMARAGRLLNEAAYLDSAIRAADYSWYRWEENQNYAAFTGWHLAALYAIDPRPEWLARAVYYLRHFATRDIGLSGAQDAHNFYTAYGNITLRGMVEVLGLLPPAHPYAPELRERTIRFTNQVLSRQQPSGLFAGRNRKYLGYHHLVPGLLFVAEALPDLAAALQPALAAMTRAALESQAGSREDTDRGQTLALALRAPVG